jgi:hypothetical protein
VLSRNAAERPKATPVPRPVYQGGLNELRMTQLKPSASAPVDASGIHRGTVALHAHLLKQIDRNYSKAGGIKWIEYQSRWDLNQACYALRGKPLAGQRPIVPLTSHLNEKKLNLSIDCELNNDLEMEEDPTTPAEYYCVTDQEISFDCEITWKE